MLNEEDRERLDRSVLCWLATTSRAGVPNVSPKEIWAPWEDDGLLIANIASPKTARNIRECPGVCAAFLDVYLQKGVQVFGEAQVVTQQEGAFGDLAAPLLVKTGGKFPFVSLFRVTVTSTQPIIAPRYRLFPETTEDEQIESALVTYRLASRLPPV